MEEQLISIETAKLAKEKGFNLNSQGYYSCDSPSSGREGNQLVLRGWEKWMNFGSEASQEGTMIYSAPSQTMLQKWLREKHNIDIIISSNVIGYGYLIYIRYPSQNKLNKCVFQTYEEALEAGLFEVLKLI